MGGNVFRFEFERRSVGLECDLLPLAPGRGPREVQPQVSHRRPLACEDAERVDCALRIVLVREADRRSIVLDELHFVGGQEARLRIAGNRIRNADIAEPLEPLAIGEGYLVGLVRRNLRTKFRQVLFCGRDELGLVAGDIGSRSRRRSCVPRRR